jgi:hypothetical protein
MLCGSVACPGSTAHEKILEIQGFAETSVHYNPPKFPSSSNVPP